MRFENAFVTCPVCSPARSALVTGLYQTTLGVQNHRSQDSTGKGRSSPQYFDSFELPVPVITDLFRGAGEDKDLETLRRILKTGNDCQKYWAATWLGVSRDRESTKALAQMATSDTPVLRVAALLALHKIEPNNEYLEGLINEINNPNMIVGMYAMNGV